MGFNSGFKGLMRIIQYIVGSNGNTRNWMSSAVVQFSGILTVVYRVWLHSLLLNLSGA